MAMLLKNGITPKDLEDSFNEGVVCGQKTTAQNFTAAMAIALHDLYGFGIQRHMKVTDRMCEIMLNTFTSAELRDEALRKLHLRIDLSDPFHLLEMED